MALQPKEEPDSNSDDDHPPHDSDASPESEAQLPEEAYHMVTQVQWEDDVIWNGDEVRQKVLQSMSERGVTAGWIPSCNSRTAEQYAQQGECTTCQGRVLLQNIGSNCS